MVEVMFKMSPISAKSNDLEGHFNQFYVGHGWV
jgi:hypothetical protein